MGKYGVLVVAFLATLAAVPAHASWILQFDEAGNGSINNNGAGFVADPGVILATDPTSSLTNVLSYTLPSFVIAGDVEVLEVTGGLSDLLRFTNNATTGLMIFYSVDTGAGLPADTGIPSTSTLSSVVENADGTFDYLSGGEGSNDYQGLSGAPEPATIGMLGLGLVALGWTARRRNKSRG